MARRIACLILVGVMLVFVSDVMADAEKEKAALAEALKWMTIVDDEKYDDSWNETAEYFKNVIIKESWERLLLAVRKPLGKLVSRKSTSTTYQTSLPGAPEGEYVIISFQTSFENKKSAVETVVTTLDKDGTWRVSGYFIK